MSPHTAYLPMQNLSRSLIIFRVLITPLQTRSFKHLPPVPSLLLLVLVDASNTGLAGVETDSLNWILHGIKYWTSLLMNCFFVSSSNSSRWAGLLAWNDTRHLNAGGRLIIQRARSDPGIMLQSFALFVRHCPQPVPALIWGICQSRPNFYHHSVRFDSPAIRVFDHLQCSLN